MLTGKTRYIPFALAFAHLILAVWFAYLTPYRTPGMIGRTLAPDIGAPDERAHANYIQSVVDTGTAPTLDVKRMGSDPSYRRENYENHQPPLYYFLAAGWAQIVTHGRVDTAPSSSERNPDPQDSASIGFRLRVLNCLIGASTVVAVFLAGYWGFRRLDIAVGAAGFAAFLPMNVALSGAISNDPLLFLWLSCAVAIAALGVREGWSMKRLLILGVFCGLAVLTKTTGLASLPMALAAVLVPQVQRPKPVWIAAGAAAFLVLAGPIWLRNERVYGDPLAVSVFNQAFSDTATKEQIVALAQSNGGTEKDYWVDWVGWWTARSFVGVFGYMDVWMNETGTPRTGPGSPNTLYRVSIAVFALLAIGWLMSLKQAWAPETKGVTIVNLVLLLVVVALFIRFNQQFFQAQARYLLPALAPLGIGFASGAVGLGKQNARYVVGTLLVFLLALDLYALQKLPAEFMKREGQPPGMSNGL